MRYPGSSDFKPRQLASSKAYRGKYGVLIVKLLPEVTVVETEFEGSFTSCPKMSYRYKCIPIHKPFPVAIVYGYNELLEKPPGLIFR